MKIIRKYIGLILFIITFIGMATMYVDRIDQLKQQEKIIESR